MAGPYFIDSTATGGGTGADWTNAFTSMKAMQDYGGAGTGPGTSGNRLLSTDVVYIDSDSIDGATYGVSTTLYGPASGAPAKIISVDKSDDSYAQSAAEQIAVDDGAYNFTIDGVVAVYGAWMKAGQDITFTGGAGVTSYFEECTFELGDNDNFLGTANQHIVFRDCVVDLQNDSAASTQDIFALSGTQQWDVQGLSFTNGSNRTGDVFNNPTGFFSGIDTTGLNCGSTHYLVSAMSAKAVFTNCLLDADMELYDSSSISNNFAETMFTNCGTADDPAAMAVKNAFGEVVSSNSIYRTGGGAFEDINTGWALSTTAESNESTPLKTPWIGGRVTATGNRTFTVYIQNDEADRDDDEIWLEVEYLSAADEALWSVATDRRASIVTTPAAQADDSSDWSTDYTYKQKLQVTVSVGETGQCRARVCCGLTSYSSGTLFVDPQLEIT